MKRRFIIEVQDDRISDVEAFKFVQHVLQAGKISVHPDGRGKYCHATAWANSNGLNTIVYSPPQYKSTTDKFIVYTEKQKEIGVE